MARATGAPTVHVGVDAVWIFGALEGCAGNCPSVWGSVGSSENRDAAGSQAFDFTFAHAGQIGDKDVAGGVEHP